jgi:hypothetical protein
MSGAAGFGLASVAAPADAEPKLSKRGDVLVVSYRGRWWELDPRQFGQASSDGEQRPGEIRLRLRNARFAGTDIRLDLFARIFETQGRWLLSLSLPRLSVAGAVDLADWMAGAATVRSAVSGRFALGDDCLVAMGAGVAELDAAFNLSLIAAPGGLQVDGPMRCRARSLALRPSPPGPSRLRRAISGLESAPGTAFVFGGVESLGQPCLSCGSSAASARFRPSALSGLSGEAAERSGRRSAVHLVQGNGSLSIHQRGAAAPAALKVERAAALLARQGRRRQMLVAAAPALQTPVDLGFGLAWLDGEESPPFYADFVTGRDADFEFTARLKTLHLPAMAGAEAIVDFDAAAAETLFVSRAQDPEAEGADAGTDGRAADGQGAIDDERSIICFGARPEMAVPLARARLVLRRGADLFSAGFELEGYTLRKDREGDLHLRRRRPPHLTAPWPEARMTVHFSPQHVGETFTEAQEPRCDTEPAKIISDARQYGPSRLVFDLGGGASAPRWFDRPLSVEALTDWAHLPMIVTPRAASRLGTELDPQLEFTGISEDHTLKEAFNLIKATLKPPAARETALEMHGRLIFSPSEKGGWLTPRTAPGVSTPIWNARLNAVGRASVRAVWSTWLKPETFQYCAQSCWESKPPTGDDTLALSPSDHREIVGQTAIYGLPALRRIAGEDEPSEPGEQQFRNIPRAGVVRPEKNYKYIDQAEPAPLKGEGGVAIAYPFNDADISLTSQGGIFVADWRGDPPRLLRGRTSGQDEFRKRHGFANADEPCDFELERLSIETWLGRDVRVEAIRKGYLFPLGVRASFVQLAERRFLRHPKHGYPVAYELRRSFILIQRPDKQYPALNQPFDGREFPPRHIEMLTRQTPDLLNPLKTFENDLPATIAYQKEAGRILDLPDLSAETLVFWPRTTALKAQARGPGDVDFKWSVDGDPAPAISNLLFVGNGALGSEIALEGIVKRYRDRVKTDPVLRTVRLFGAKRRYAPTDKEGETSYDTDSWMLGATGRLLPVEGGQEQESFLMDGRMEGADQPPFYPRLEEARIVVQTADRLLGRPLGLVRVNYFDKFVRNGFAAANEGEIYLQVLGPEILLDAGRQSDAVGGFAQPEAYLAALSRKTGLVGGRKGKARSAAPAADAGSTPAARSAAAASPPSGPEKSAAAADAPWASGGTAAFDFPGAANGEFRPDEFFGQGAKLLGLIDLGLVVGQALEDFGKAPRLVETIAFGALGQGSQQDVLARVRAAAARIRPAVQQAVKAVDAAISKIQITRPDPENPGRVEVVLAFADLYPNLARYYADAKVRLVGADLEGGGLRTIENATSLAAVTVAAGPIVASLRPLLPEIARIAKDPIPELIQVKIDALAGYWATLVKLIDSEFDKFVEQLVASLLGQLSGRFCEEVDRHGLTLPLLGLEDGVSCAQFLRNPGDVAGRAGAALFERRFAEPLRRLILIGRELEAEATAKLSLAARALRGEILAIVDAAVARIEPVLSKDAEIRGEAARAALVEALVDAVAADVDRAFQEAAGAGSSLEEILDAVEAQSAALPQLVRDRVREWRNKFGEDADDAFEEFREQALQPISDAAIRRVGDEVGRVRELVKKRIARKRDEIIKHVIDIADRMIDGFISTSAFARIAKVGAQAQGWCQAQIPGVVIAADAVAGGMLAAQDEIGKAVKDIADKCAGVTVPGPVDPALKLDIETAVRKILELNQSLARTALIIGEHRKTLDDFVSGLKQAQCTRLGDFLVPASQLMTLRIEAADRLEEMLGQAVALVAAMEKAAMPDAATVSKLLTTQFQLLLSGLTSLQGVAAAGPAWAKVKTAVADAKAATGAATAYAGQLDEAVKAIVQTGKALKSDIDAAASPAALRELADRIGDYALVHDKALAALILQSAGMAKDGAEAVMAIAAGALNAVGDTLHSLHDKAKSGLEQLLTALGPVQLLINPDVWEQLKKATKDLDVDVHLLKRLSDSNGDPDAAFAAAVELQKHWRAQSPPTLVRVLANFLELIDKFLRGDIGAMLNTDLRPALQALEAAAREIVEQFVPTGITLDYNFSAPLNPFPKNNPIFQMTDGARDTNLVLKSEIHVDFITGRRSVRVRGDLEPFTIKLIGREIPMANLLFNASTFESVDGSKPTFKTSVKQVVLGRYLEFIQPLQAWLAPSQGNGFYIEPIVGAKLGVEAGYVYDAGVIQIGSVQFINVAFGVAARLFFDGAEAEFEFRLASRSRPFLIASPPYGGGGYVRLVGNAQGIKEIELSFVMGAVTAIKFGPLRAQGRVVMGFMLRLFNGGKDIVILTEAVGEGNIACFSICVSLQVLLTRQDEGAVSTMWGKASYSFSFKMGLIRYRYHFTAHYTLKGNKKSGGQAASSTMDRAIPSPAPRNASERCRAKPDDIGQPDTTSVCGVPGVGARYVNRVPPKSTHWRSYRRRVAHDLL